jgi:hypothetical protein
MRAVHCRKVFCLEHVTDVSTDSSRHRSLSPFLSISVPHCLHHFSLLLSAFFGICTDHRSPFLLSVQSSCSTHPHRPNDAPPAKRSARSHLSPPRPPLHSCRHSLLSLITAINGGRISPTRRITSITRSAGVLAAHEEE